MKGCILEVNPEGLGKHSMFAAIDGKVCLPLC